MRARALIGIWGGGGSLDLGLATALDPFAAGRAWCAQGAAWLLAEGIPLMLVVRAEATERRTIARLQAQRAALDAEWATP